MSPFKYRSPSMSPLVLQILSAENRHAAPLIRFSWPHFPHSTTVIDRMSTMRSRWFITRHISGGSPSMTTAIAATPSARPKKSPSPACEIKYMKFGAPSSRPASCQGRIWSVPTQVQHISADDMPFDAAMPYHQMHKPIYPSRL